MANTFSNICEVFKRFRNGGGTKLEAERERVMRELNRCKSDSNRRYEDRPYTLVNQYYNNLLLVFACIFMLFTIICITIFLIFHYVYQDDKYKYVIMSFFCASTICCAVCVYYMGRRLRRIWHSVKLENESKMILVASMELS
ncbi:uncharacterized protein [Parasteatoda tepidariorum]|uniref:uncharacterized protein n=1 Tax=Parasteatoda tepidariorum TaxID=114398 RepID=UPI001C727DFD|nr:uncharacterized protein LOC122270157 [Parasteatoda tepidariorum]